MIKDIIGATYNNYTVLSFEGNEWKGKTKIEYYKIIFNDTKNEQLEKRSKIISGKCKDLAQIKLDKSKIKQEKLKTRCRATKQIKETYHKQYQLDKMNILILDQAQKTGYAYYKNAKYQRSGVVICDKHIDYYKNILELSRWVENVLIKLKIDLIVFEGIYLGLNANTLEKLAALKGCLICKAIEKNVPYEVVSGWKNHFGMFGMKREQQKSASIAIVKQRYNKVVTDDEADAVLIGEYIIEKYNKGDDSDG